MLRLSVDAGAEGDEMVVSGHVIVGNDDAVYIPVSQNGIQILLSVILFVIIEVVCDQAVVVNYSCEYLVVQLLFRGIDLYLPVFVKEVLIPVVLKRK